ncbi:acetylxylan esterase [Paenibacillus sp. IB182496]|uniref:Acetylxylan esterase n=1 Tax=Paenibacillus sabuli TaxID=2772509 RepID=A0A927BXI7_9BACL|nr:acetylxylan esterase [Paenibacillus sabuli]MBD2847716.1 acetylxylan esterase [Paenibacillus sabuli]
MNTLLELERYTPTLYDTQDQLKTHIFARTDEALEAGERARDALATADQLRIRQAAVRDAFLASIGGLPTGGPLHGRSSGELRTTDYRIERILFESRPGHPVTANLYMPHGLHTPAPAVLFLCGHERGAKHSPLYRRVCGILARSGLIVLAVDPLGQGERLGYLEQDGADGPVGWGTHEHQHVGAQCLPLGLGLARYFVHDAMRAVDYLLTRPEVDPARIGVTGNSGGGTQTAMLMLCDPRLAAAAPGTFITGRSRYMHAGGVQDAEQVWPGWSAAGYDHEDLLLACCPRPVLVLAATSDFFPIEATRRTVARAARYWELLGVPGGLALVEDASTHSYTDVLAEAAAAFFAERLGAVPGATDSSAMQPEAIAEEQLWCVPSGQVLRELSGVRTVHDELVAETERLREARQLRSEAADARGDALDWLRARVLGPRRTHSPNLRRQPLGVIAGLEAELRMWWAQDGIMNSGIWLQAAGSASTEPAAPAGLTLALWEGGTTSLTRHEAWLHSQADSGRAVLVLNLSGIGPHAPYPIYGKPPLARFGVMHKLADELIWIGDSLAALHAHDMIRALDALPAPYAPLTSPVEAYACGRDGVALALAAALDARIGETTIAGDWACMTDWVMARDYDDTDIMRSIMPGMLRWFDLDELAAWRASAAPDR